MAIHLPVARRASDATEPSAVDRHHLVRQARGFVYVDDATQYQAETMGVMRNFRSPTGQAVWSVVIGTEGLSTSSATHGNFDNDQQTLRSVQHLLRSGY